jgi:hypothetical protein
MCDLRGVLGQDDKGRQRDQRFEKGGVNLKSCLIRKTYVIDKEPSPGPGYYKNLGDFAGPFSNPNWDTGITASQTRQYASRETIRAMVVIVTVGLPSFRYWSTMIFINSSCLSFHIRGSTRPLNCTSSREKSSAFSRSLSIFISFISVQTVLPSVSALGHLT